MQTVLVSLPQYAFRGAPTERPYSTLSSVLARLNMKRQHRRGFGQIWRLFGISELEASDRFAKQRDKTMSEAKIHAEIQVIFYIETIGPQPLPRVICSSKDACFLCNAFIAMHGKFHTPRHHGRLYPGWRLPHFPQPSDLERRFIQMLDNHAKDKYDLNIADIEFNAEQLERRERYCAGAQWRVPNEQLRVSSIGQVDHCTPRADAR
ncbi:deaminase domain-containing protein [Hirsutella rhossiliensis]|uniref:Deaminase domain-containing protein n=1 Tax=Hirsutella rhossiliensis TaxID=111463 RepID=A0A9P8N881_9HYPO|nr:deaminase domain-containing protein [Hirsutella rhossiliensis]KAH0967781.1 deaminase domain-containing protein [Hirsutella rhossiliensis]